MKLIFSGTVDRSADLDDQLSAVGKEQRPSDHRTIQHNDQPNTWVPRSVPGTLLNGGLESFDSFRFGERAKFGIALVPPVYEKTLFRQITSQQDSYEGWPWFASSSNVEHEPRAISSTNYNLHEIHSTSKINTLDIFSPDYSLCCNINLSASSPCLHWRIWAIIDEVVKI